jgi:4-amino-4-deoxy-L-arabinose transferase-like glycosyltransferase
MTKLTMSLSSRSFHWRAGAAALLLLALTAVHHAYGAYAFSTPWRLHIVYVAAPVAIAIAAALYFGSHRPDEPSGRIATWIGAVIILAFPVLAIGIFEGGYNHLVKNIVYFGLGEPTAIALFPPPTYEMPSDFFFEVTGIAQFPLGILTALFTLGLLRQASRGG